MCMMAGTDEYQMEELGSTLLEVFHDVCRYNTEAANDMMADLCYHPDICFEKEDEIAEMDTAVTRLEIFLTDARRDEYEREIESIQQTAGMLRIMDALKYRVFSFGKYGPEYVDILNTRYMNRFDYTNTEASEILRMGESTYYRKKKAAVILLVWHSWSIRRTAAETILGALIRMECRCSWPSKKMRDFLRVL